MEHIAESIELVQQYLAGADGRVDRELFFRSQEKQDAVLRRLETLADAASYLSDGLKAVVAAEPKT